MKKVRLTKVFTFEMAHALFNYAGKCRNIHGHSYKLEVTISGSPRNIPGDPEDGLLVDFGELKTWVNKAVINEYDHSLVMKKDYSNALNKALTENFERLLYVDFQPTCENLIIDFAHKIEQNLPGEVNLHHLVLHETTTAYCEWHASDNA
jgi:6-pyruvoyltetrahydropterin/6-carboxytetrahydropterin synthase